MNEAEPLTPRTPRRTLPPPPVGGRPFDGETPRAFNARMRQEKQARREAVDEGHDYSKDCACSGCQTWGAVQAATYARKLEPKTSLVLDCIREARDKWFDRRRGG